MAEIDPISLGLLYLKFDKTVACEEGYGVVVEVLEHVPSAIACAVECSGNPNCASSVYNITSESCKLNNDTWLSTKSPGCKSDVFYLLNRSLKPVCSPGKPCTSPMHNLRLCDGGGAGVCDPKQGRIEVLYKDTWGTVCDDYWNDGFYYNYMDYHNDSVYSDYDVTESNAEVLCRMFGYKNGTARPDAFYGSIKGTIWKDDIRCHGNETSLYQCPSNAWGDHNCEHSEDVGVSCDSAVKPVYTDH